MLDLANDIRSLSEFKRNTVGARSREWLGEAARATPSELQAVRDEWRSAVPRRPARRKA